MYRSTESIREPALTVRREVRPFYAALFVLQTGVLVARRFYLALTESYDGAADSLWSALWTAAAEGRLLDIAAISLSELERDGGKAVISTIILMEVWDAMMATRDAVNDWLEKRREKARSEGRAEGRAEGIAEGRAEGIAEGRAEGIAEMVGKVEEWNKRRLAAEANGEPFDEPPPQIT